MDPYEAGIAKGRSRSIKSGVHAQVVVVLDTKRTNRQLDLIYPYSRCVCASEVHELVLTDDVGSKPGNKVDRVAGIGFATFTESGVLMVGDELRSPRLGLLGIVAGFDSSHAPNHFNIVLYNDLFRSGRELGLQLNEELDFSSQLHWPEEPENG